MSLILIEGATQQQATLKQKLEAIRALLRVAGREVQASEGRLLDYAAADEISRALGHATRQLDVIAIAVAVLERKEVTRG
jgi:hypothetical protein